MLLEFPSGETLAWRDPDTANDIVFAPNLDRPAWLAARQRDVTASAAGALFGVHDYQTAMGLWSLKSGRTSEDPEETPPMRRGRMLEPVALQMLREERPGWQIAGGCNHYWRDTVRQIGCTPDCYVITETGRHAVVQFKTVEPSVFVRKWQGGDRYGVIEPPLWIVIQAITEAKLTGAEQAFVAALVIGHGIELHIIEVPMHVGVLEKLYSKVAEFWQFVRSAEPPPAHYGKDADLIAKLYPIPNSLVIDLRDSNRIVELIEIDKREAEIAKTATARREDAKTELKHMIGLKAQKGETVGNGQPGEATIVMYPGGIITAKNILRRSYTTKDTIYVDVRIKDGVELSDATKARATKPKAAPKKLPAASTDDPEVF